jgi:hypothetical protein
MWLKVIVLLLVLLLPFSPFCKAVETVDIGVFYTTAALKQNSKGELYALMLRRLLVANEALRASGINLQRRIVFFEPSPLWQGKHATMKRYLHDLRRSSVIATVIERFGVDYVTVLSAVQSRDLCGYSQLGGVVSVIRVSVHCNRGYKDYLFAHEWGHNDGASHELGDIAKLPYGVGYVCDDRGTIMSNESGKRHTVYSSPNININGEACGVHDKSDVTRLIKERMKLPGAIHNTHPKMIEIGSINLAAEHTALNRNAKIIKGRLQLNKVLATSVSVQVYARNISTNKEHALVMMRVYFPPGKVDVSFELPLGDQYFGADDNVEVGLRYPEKLKVLSVPQVVSTAK